MPTPCPSECRPLMSPNGPERVLRGEKARKEVKSKVKRALREGHRELVEEAYGDMKKIWKLYKWARRRSSPSPYTPAMQKPDGTYAGSSKEKAELLFKRFLPISPPADTSEIDTSSYPPTVEWPRIMKQKIERAIKGPGQDKIPNRALRAGLTVLLPHLDRLYNGCLFHRYHSG